MENKTKHILKLQDAHSTLIELFLYLQQKNKQDIQKALKEGKATLIVDSAKNEIEPDNLIWEKKHFYLQNLVFARDEQANNIVFIGEKISRLLILLEKTKGLFDE